MIWTLKGHKIEFNGITEWLLFERMNLEVNCIDFLSTTDSAILIPNFFFTLSLLTMFFVSEDFETIILVSSMFYFLGQLIIKLRLGIILFLLKFPLQVYNSISNIIQLLVFITAFFFLGWWTLLIIPIYIFTLVISVIVLNYHERLFYRYNWESKAGFYDIFKNNAFICTYDYYSMVYDLEKDIAPTNGELETMAWFNAQDFMRYNWLKVEPYFDDSAKLHWRAYLNIE